MTLKKYGREISLSTVLLLPNEVSETKVKFFSERVLVKTGKFARSLL